MASGDGSEVAVRPELDRRLASSPVFDALTAVIPGLRVEELDGRQELYADRGLDSLGFVELESKLGVPWRTWLIWSSAYRFGLQNGAWIGYRRRLPRRETYSSPLTGSTSCTTGPSTCGRRASRTMK
jgi:hypothetical protein